MTALCMACGKTAAIIRCYGEPLCEGCFAGSAQERLSAPDVDDGDVAIVAMWTAQLIAVHPNDAHVFTIGAPGIAEATWGKFATSLAFHGLHLERDDVEGWADVFNLNAVNARAHRLAAAACGGLAS